MLASEHPVVLVTGGRGPLGRSICQLLTRGGARVLSVDVLPRLDDVSSADQYICDLTDSTAVDALISSLERSVGRLNCLINNAALTGTSAVSGYSTRFEVQSEAAFDQALLLNLSVPFRLTRRLLPLLRRGVDPTIINVASIYGLVGPDMRLYEGTSLGNPAGYAASKGGLIQLTRYLATVLAPEIRVNCVAPGGIFRNQGEHFVDAYKTRVPLQRMATEIDVSSAIAWLISPAASYITGQVLAVDGGWTAW